MTVLEQRRWIREWHALARATALTRVQNLYPEIAEWERIITPGREGEFSLMCVNEEHRCPLVYMTIQRDLTVPEHMLDDWADHKVGAALGAAHAYITKELWRRGGVQG